MHTCLDMYHVVFSSQKQSMPSCQVAHQARVRGVCSIKWDASLLQGYLQH